MQNGQEKNTCWNAISSTVVSVSIGCPRPLAAWKYTAMDCPILKVWRTPVSRMQDLDAYTYEGNEYQKIIWAKRSRNRKFHANPRGYRKDRGAKQDQDNDANKRGVVVRTDHRIRYCRRIRHFGGDQKQAYRDISRSKDQHSRIYTTSIIHMECIMCPKQIRLAWANLAWPKRTGCSSDAHHSSMQ